MIVYHFLESYDLSGKTIVPFCTHGGIGLSNTESTIADITGGTMKDGFAIPGTTAGSILCSNLSWRSKIINDIFDHALIVNIAGSVAVFHMCISQVRDDWL